MRRLTVPGFKPCRRCSAGTSPPISGRVAPSPRGNAVLRSQASAHTPEQPVLDVRNQPDNHRRRRTERRIFRLAGLRLRARRRAGPGTRRPRRACGTRTLPAPTLRASATMAPAAACRQLQVDGRYSPGTCEVGSRYTRPGLPRSVRPEYEPGHGPPAAPPPAPPGGQGRDQFQSPAALRVPASRAQPRHPGPAAVGDLDPDQAVSGRHRDRDRPPGKARAAVPDAVAEQLAHQQDRGILARVPGPSTPPVKARATRARSASPASVTLSRSAAPATRPPPSRPARPGGAPGTAAGTGRMHAQLSPGRQAAPGPCTGAAGRNMRSNVAVRGRPWKSRRCTPTVRTVHTDRPNSTDARPLYVRGQRTTTVYSATR